jgi:hypothetical protein
MLSLSFAKLVATPTESSWSQAYNAGSLFACLSLSKKPDQESELQLSAIGKEMFSHLESEFFTLENKDLTGIKEAIANSTHTIPSNIIANLCLAFFKENILYVFIYNHGKILMKRQAKVGVLLEEHEIEAGIKSASGLLQNADIIVLQTPQFATDMSTDSIGSALDLELPNDMAEALSPAMHEKDDGGQAAIIIRYADATPPTEDEAMVFETPDPQTEEETEHKEHEPVHNTPPHHEKPDPEPTMVIHENAAERSLEDEPSYGKTSQPSLFKRLNLGSVMTSVKSSFLNKGTGLRLNHTKKLFLTIAVIILLVLALSITLTRQRQEDMKTAALFESIYDPALKDYEDGQAVASINKIFARDEFLSAREKLAEGEGKFKSGSEHEKKINDLMAKINAELGGETGESKVTPKPIDLSKNDYLSIVKANSGASGFTKDQNATYLITNDAVVSVNSTGAKKDLIENDGDWETPKGLATYQGNIYVLDAENGVLKFTAGSAGFGKSSYFKTKPSNIGQAVALAIDGSVWILFKDGGIMKFTRGESDGFKATGLDKPLSSPTKIFTNLDTESLYILDRGNSRIVELGKDGNFKDQFVADILKSATDFEVSEEDGKILVLSGGKFYELPL